MFEGRPESQWQRQRHQPNLASNIRPARTSHLPRTAPVPQKFGDIWDIPVQFVGQSKQQSGPFRAHDAFDSPIYFQAGGHRNEAPARSEFEGPVPVPIVHEVSGQAPSSRSSSPFITRPDPAAAVTKSPCPSPRPDSSQVEEQPQAYSCPQEPALDNKQGLEATEQPVPQPASRMTEQPVPQPAPQTTEQPMPQPAPQATEQPVSEPAPQEEQVEPSAHEKQQEERAYEIINEIMGEVKGFEEQVNNFRGIKKDKEYRYLEEMLTRSLLKLDSVESGSNVNVRQARRQAVKYIEAAINLLELKAIACEAKANSAIENTTVSESKNIEIQSGSSDVTQTTGVLKEQENPARDPKAAEEVQMDTEVTRL